MSKTTRTEEGELGLCFAEQRRSEVWANSVHSHQDIEIIKEFLGGTRMRSNRRSKAEQRNDARNPLKSLAEQKGGTAELTSIYRVWRSAPRRAAPTLHSWIGDFRICGQEILIAHEALEMGGPTLRPTQ